MPHPDASSRSFSRDSGQATDHLLSLSWLEEEVSEYKGGLLVLVFNLEVRSVWLAFEE